MFAAMDTDVTRATAKALAMLRHRLGDIDAAYLAQIIQLARDEAIVEAVREAAYKAGEVAEEAAQYLEKKADAIEAVANGGWNAAEMLSVAMATGGATASLADHVADAAIGRAASSTSASGMARGLGGPIMDPPFPLEQVLKRWPRLEDLMEEGEIDAEDLALLMEILKNPDFDPEWFWEQLSEAIIKGDGARAKILASALWDRFERMDSEDAEKFWDEMVNSGTIYAGNSGQFVEGHYLMVLVAAAGLPKVDFIIAKSLGAIPIGKDAWIKITPILEDLGMPEMKLSDSQDLVEPRAEWWDQLIAGEIRKLGKSAKGRDALFDAFDLVDGPPPWISKETDAAIFDMTADQPEVRDIVLSWAAKSPAWAQRFADHIAEDATDEQIATFFAYLLDRAAYADITTADGQETLKALAQMDQSFKDAGRGSPSVNMQSILGIMVGFIPGGSGTVAGVLWSALGAVEEDGLMESLELKTDVGEVSDNLAVMVLIQKADHAGADAVPTPSGKVITDWLTEQGKTPPYDANDMADLKLAAKTEPLKSAYNELETTSQALEEAHKAVS